MAQAPRAVIFDVDGTLVDSNDAHVRAWQQAFERVGKRVGYDPLQEQMGKGADNLVPVFCTREELEAHGEALKRLHVEIYVRDFLPEVRPFPGVRALFEALKAHGLRIALASSATGQELEHNVRTLGIDGLFDYATSGDDVQRSKPCPDVFQAALGGLEGMTAGDAIVVGDTPYDAMAAGRIGVRAVGVLTGGFSEQRLRAAGAVAVYPEVCELIALVNRGSAAPFP